MNMAIICVQYCIFVIPLYICYLNTELFICDVLHLGGGGQIRKKEFKLLSVRGESDVEMKWVLTSCAWCGTCCFDLFIVLCLQFFCTPVPSLVPVL